MKATLPCRIFIIEDDPTYTKFLRYVFELNPDYELHFFETGKAAIESLHLRPEIISLDYALPDLTGEEVLQAVLEFDPEISVIVISAQEKIGTAVNMLKMGAFDYIVKDNDAKDRILNSTHNARNRQTLVREIVKLKSEVATKFEFDNSIIGTSPAIRKTFEMLEKAVKTNITVSIYGETGTGKELAAKAIHYNSKRKHKPFVAVNVSAIPRELLEGELFGYEKGAFTSAIARRIGKFEEAEGGTLFLDEIGELDLSLQAKLLRVLQEKEVTRIGSNEVIKLDVRIIVATHKNLSEEVKAGRFREDLYYRLLGLPIVLPPLRERGQDIILLAKFFLDNFVRENQMDPVRISENAQRKLQGYHYPGNVRELRSIIELAAVLCEGGEIGDKDITFNNSGTANLLNHDMTLEEYTYHIIRSYLTKYDNNVIEVSDKLGIGKSSIYRYLKEMEAKGI
ncbi:MAG: sigma-54-dependent transcriptional regulator [Bacteroidota bacterium]